MTTEQMEAKMRDLIQHKDYAGVASFIVDNGRSSLDLKFLVRDALMAVAGKEAGK